MRVTETLGDNPLLNVFVIDDWLLFDMESPNYASARGFVRGEFYTRDGLLVASVAQKVRPR